MKSINNDSGFTLLELVIVMTIFLVIIMVTTSSFDKIVYQTSQLKKTSETNIEGIVGLESMRRDLASAGYGLPWAFSQGISYAEAQSDLTPGFSVDGIDPHSLNDAPSAVPRAIISGSSSATSKMIDATGIELTNPGTDYFSIKSVNVSLADCARKWRFVSYSASGSTNLSYITQSVNSDENFVTNDSLITLVDSTSTGSVRSLAMMGASAFSYKYAGITPPQAVYQPGSKMVRSSDNASITPDLYTVYGVNNLGSSDNIAMPFNRVDYFVKRPVTDMPSYCNKGTGVLFKAIVNNTTGSNGGKYLTQIPLLDCVGDMQVVYELDTSGTAKSGAVSYTDTLTSMDAQAIREQVRTIRVYLLAHEGKKDRNFSYPYTNAASVITVGDPNMGNLGRVFSKTTMDSYFGTDWINYRWKVYTIAVSPKNLYN